MSLDKTPSHLDSISFETFDAQIEKIREYGFQHSLGLIRQTRFKDCRRTRDRWKYMQFVRFLYLSINRTMTLLHLVLVQELRILTNSKVYSRIIQMNVVVH